MGSEQIIAILIASGVVAALGVVVGLFLGLSGKALAVPVDEKIEAVRECLPGNNCGGCGYSGCDGLAEAMARGDAPPNACPVGGADVAEKIAEVLGVDASATQRMVAFVKCSGSCDRIQFKYQYYGDGECRRAAIALGHGNKACRYACTGLGSCASVCPFDAITLVGGRAVVDPDECRACGKCIATCPHGLIEMIPADAAYAVRCHSQDKGKEVRAVCSAGCIGCGICAKVCPEGAITVSANVAHIDQSLCTGCGKCAAKCPAKVIVCPTACKTV